MVGDIDANFMVVYVHLFQDLSR